MAATTVTGAQVRAGTVQRSDLDISTVGNAVIRKLVQGSGVTLSSTGADPGTGDVTINATGNFDPSVNADFTALQSISITNANATTDDSVLALRHRCSGTPAANFGTCLWLLGNSATVADRDMAQLFTAWSIATDATRTSYMGFRLINSASAFVERMRLHASGGLAIGTTGLQTDPGANFLNVPTGGGYKINNVACMPPSGGTAGQLLAKNTSNPFDFSWDTFAAAQTAQVTTAGTVSTTGVMAGFAASFTPTITGRALIICSGYLRSSVAGAFAGVTSLRYGTGTAPAHGAALTGTLITNASAAVGHSAAVNYTLPFSICCVLTGLTVGTTYWVDAGYGTSAAGSTATLITSCISIMEF